MALKEVVTHTPLLEDLDVNAMLGGRLILKPENFQRTGSFKFRGAHYRMSTLSSEERARGAVTYSSGNHALGLARTAQILGTSAVIVMPSDVPATKRKAVQSMGAEIVTYDRDTQDSADVVTRIMAETGRVEGPPSAHADVLAGAGTTALEMLADAGPLDAVLVPCGGGGLAAATAITMHEGSTGTRVYSAQPALFDDTRRSLAAGKRLSNPKGQRTICDAIMTPIPNTVTFPINHALLAGGVTATDEGVRVAMRFAFIHFKIVAEPGAVVGLAAILNGQIPIKGRCIATVITGGNIDAGQFLGLLEDIS